MAIGWQRQIVGCESITSIDAEQVTVGSKGLRLVTVGLAGWEPVLATSQSAS